MIKTLKTTLDASGRVVVPKPICELAGIGPGDPVTVVYRDGRIEIEPAPRIVRIRERDGFRIAELVGPDEMLQESTVRRTREEVRDLGGLDPGDIRIVVPE